MKLALTNSPRFSRAGTSCRFKNRASLRSTAPQSGSKSTRLRGVDISMNPGAVNENVEVTAAAALLEASHFPGRTGDRDESGEPICR